MLSVVTELKQNKKIASATHNILAYRSANLPDDAIFLWPTQYKKTLFGIYNCRLLDSTKGVVVQDCDDDGESAAGGRLLHLLQVYILTYL